MRKSYALGILGAYLVGCGAASSGEEPARRTSVPTCDGGDCRQEVNDDDDAPVPCPVVERREVEGSELQLLAVPSGTPPFPMVSPNPAPPVTAPVPTMASGGEPLDPDIPDPAPTVPVTPLPPLPTCGDGALSGSERCDDGNTLGGDGCGVLCDIEAGFECAVPGMTCVFVATCGDGVVTPPEVCDDANLNDGDGCGATCVLEPGYSCPVPGSACEAFCGDQYVTGAEQCEDGNRVSGDGCSDRCLQEAGYNCPLAASQLIPLTAAAVLAVTPSAAVVPSVADAALPLPEPNPNPATPIVPSAEPPVISCYPSVCGNGLLENAEACDDGNTAEGDGCSPLCILEPNCTDDVCTPICGDGVVDESAGEQCDDGNRSRFDGCSESCVIEPGFVCTSMPPLGGEPVQGVPEGISRCGTVCGDGIVGGQEQCDEGEAPSNSYGGCTDTCVFGPRCGDGVVDAEREQCDNGLNRDAHLSGETSCAAGCVLPPSCGDGVVDPGFEQCDHGTENNTGAYGDCTAECQVPRCGDGILQSPNESCDDAGNVAGDGCDPNCQAEALTPPTPTDTPEPDVFIPDAPASVEPTPDTTAPEGPTTRPNPCR